MLCDFCQCLPRLVRRRVQLLQHLRQVRAVAAVRVAVALTDLGTLKMVDDERVAPFVM